jgi:hypothetical protein
MVPHQSWIGASGKIAESDEEYSPGFRGAAFVCEMPERSMTYENRKKRRSVERDPTTGITKARLDAFEEKGWLSGGYIIGAEHQNAGGFDQDGWASEEDPTCTIENGGVAGKKKGSPSVLERLGRRSKAACSAGI